MIVMFHQRILPCFGVLLFLFLSSCGGGGRDQPAVDPAPPLTLRENLVIESGDEQDDAPLFPFVTNLTVDSEGNIYVYAGSDGVNMIHKYDSSGKYLQTIGREGRGPGEHLYVSDLYVDRKSRLITADRENARISTFDEEYNVLSIQSLSGISSVHQIGETPNGKFVLSGWNSERARMLHVMGTGFEGYEKSLISPDSLAVYYNDGTAKQWLARAAGYFHFSDEDRLYFIPGYYDGTIYEYAKEPQGSWSLRKKHQGYATIDPPLEFSQMSADIPQNRLNGIITTPQGAAMISINSESFGIYPLNNGTLLHISHRWDTESDEFVMVIEQFSEKMELLKRATIKNLDLGTTSRILPYWADRGGQLYLADNSDESFSVVRRYQIEGLAEN